MEKIVRSISGYLELLLTLGLVVGGIYLFINYGGNRSMLIWGGILLAVALFISAGPIIVSPNPGAHPYW
ncbi:hypothetical protein [Flavihumibacter sp. ZG627]|uniref:hypothetical protein n=1 Tax=Flavihumibacter sp. ZG627 TaxID=1463156 RepID=UPI00057F29AB|nr:hypothetical protein [Flavihumibacter sp. ZG627]KIC91547.1 hypothetical protein HY58_04705 [Flavihumibacter sp. ZG627]